MRFIYSIKTAGSIDVDPALYMEITGSELSEASSEEVIDFIHQQHGDPRSAWSAPYVVSEEAEPWEL